MIEKVIQQIGLVRYRTSDGSIFDIYSDAHNHEISFVKERLKPHTIYANEKGGWWVYSGAANPQDISVLHFIYHRWNNPIPTAFYICDINGGHVGVETCWSSKEEFLKYLNQKITDTDNERVSLQNMRFKIMDLK